MIRECDMLKRFDLDLQLKVTEPFKSENFEILSSLLLKIESGKKTSKGILCKSTLISVAVKAVS